MTVPERLKYFIKKNYSSMKNFADEIGEENLYRYTGSDTTPNYNKLAKFYEAGLSLDWLISEKGSMYAMNEAGIELKKRQQEFQGEECGHPFKYLEEWIKKNFGNITNYSIFIDINSEELNDILYNDYSISMEVMDRLEWSGCNLTWLSTGEGDEYSKTPNGEILRYRSKQKKSGKEMPPLVLKSYSNIDIKEIRDIVSSEVKKEIERTKESQYGK